MTDLETEITFKALTSLGYGGSFGETLDSFRLNNGNVLTSVQRQELDEEITKLQAAYDAKAYSRNRAAEYPSIADQLDDIYHNGIDAWKATIKTTKDKYPKPSE